jgi:hypothetical protein
MKSQDPCDETLVTSTREVLGPGATDFIEMLLHQCQGFVQTLGAKNTRKRHF